MTVVYYIQIAFLDGCVEIINILKKHVDLHVLIEITPQGKNLTIMDLDRIPDNKTLVTPEEMLSEKGYEYLQPYLDGAASVHFVVHPHQTGFSFTTFQASYRVWNYIKQFRADIFHFETVSLRAIGLLPFLLAFKNVVITIHDPVPHTGEHSWKVSLPRRIFFNIPVKIRYLFYSHFAKNQFEQHYKKIKHPKMVLQMGPYTYLARLLKSEQPEKKHILFFGRLSRYKGLEDLLKAMPAVFKEYPNEQLVIAGKRFPRYIIDEDMINRYKNNITLIERYISNEELAELIQQAKFVVCPYKDATQSGVLMTAFGLKTPVIATNVGSFPEFIEDDVNGLLVSPHDPQKLAESICFALQNDHYKTLAQNINNNNIQKLWNRNTDILLNAYAL